MSNEIRKLLNDDKALQKAARPAFNEIDSDRSGYIEEAELYQAMQKTARAIGAKAPSKDQVKQITIEIDKNQDGRVSFDEFVELLKRMLRELLGEPEEVKQLSGSTPDFEEIDRNIANLDKLINNQQALAKVSRPSFIEIDADNSGYIDENELLQVMIKTATSLKTKPPSKNEVKQVLTQIDKNSDGRVSFEEYQDMLRVMLRKKIEDLERQKNGGEANNPNEAKENMIFELKRILNDTQALTQIARPSFLEIDGDRSGFIEEKELFKVMVQASQSMRATAPTKEQVRVIMREIDRNQDGKINFEEFLDMMRALLRRKIDELEGRNEIIDEEQASQQIELFERYLEDSGIAMAFQIIYTEILSKKIEPNNVFTYTAMRLRQIGKEVAHLLPKNLTAQLARE